MGAYVGLRVDPADLVQTAAELEEQHLSIGSGLAATTDPTLAAAAALPGWHTGTSTEELLQLWRDSLDGFRQRLGVTARGLRGCARNYEHADAAAAGRFVRPSCLDLIESI